MKIRRKQVALAPRRHGAWILRPNGKSTVLLVLLVMTATISVSEIMGTQIHSTSGPSVASPTTCGSPTVITVSQLELLTTNSIVPDKRSLTPPCTVTYNSVTYPTYVEMDHVTVEYSPYTGDCDAVVSGYCDVHLEFGCTISAGCLFEIDQTWFAAGYTYPVNTQGVGIVVAGTVVNATGFLYIDDHGIHELHPVVSVSVYGVPPPPTCKNGAIDPPACVTCPSGYVMNNGSCVVQPTPVSTSFMYAPMNPSINSQVTFAATATGGTSPYTLSWNFGDGSTGTGATIVHSFTSAQSFSVTETARDSSSPSQSAISSNRVNILATPPSLSTSFTSLPSSPITNSPVTFNALTTGGSAPYAYSWDFGDASTDVGSSVSHVYSGSGSYTVGLQVSDSNGLTASVSTVITIAAAIAPVLRIPDHQTLTVGATLTFVVRATDANPGAIVVLSVTKLPPGATFNPASGVFYWIPRVNQTGSYAIVFSATDTTNPSQQDTAPLNVTVLPASPAPTNGGTSNGGSNGGTSSSSKGICLSCIIQPVFSSTWGLLVIGGALGLFVSLALVTINARSDLKRAKHRMKRLAR